MSVLDDYLATLGSAPIDDSDGVAREGSEQDDRTHAGQAASQWAFSAIEPALVAERTIRSLAARLDRGETSSVELVTQVLDEVSKSEALEAGWAHVNPAAVEDARSSDERRSQGELRGPLDGIPVGVKDLIHVAGQPTGCGSQHSYPGQAREDATCIAYLREAGAVIVGKTTTHEFAFGGTTPPTRNPWNPDRIPGGSSGGSGAVVGAGLVPLAIGTDTAGSVRIPASHCGAVGFIGTRGAVSTSGVATLAWSLDTVGPLTRSVHDAALVNAVMAGRDATGAAPEPTLPSVVGLPRGVLSPLDPGVEAAFTAALDTLATHGVATVDVEWPDEAALQAVGFILMMVESADFHRKRMEDPAKFDPEVAELLGLGEQISAVDYVRARRIQAAIAESSVAIFERVPVVITPTLPCPPAPYGSGTFTPLPLGEDSLPLAAAHTRYPLIANVAGLPAGTVPCGFASGLPVGLQVLGAPGTDDIVLSVMAGIESVLDTARLWEAGTHASAQHLREGNSEDA